MNVNNHYVHETTDSMRQWILQAEIFLRDIWRYRWASIITAWIIAIIGWTVVYGIPDKYEANTKILVDTDSILRPLLKGLAVETDIQSRVSMMTKTLLSRPNLEKLMRATDMDINATTPGEKEGVLSGLRNQINIIGGGNKRSKSSTAELFTISYMHKDPGKAKEVVQALLDIFVETTLGGSRKDSVVAQKFLVKQLKEYELKLVVAEKRLMEFKQKNSGLIPGQGKDYFSHLQETQDKYQEAQFELRQAQHKHDEIKRQLNEMLTAAAKPGSNSIPTAADTRIEALEKQLDNLLLKYTEEHPDVKEIKEKLKILQERKKEELAALAEGTTSNSVMDSNPVYQELRLALGKAATEVSTAKVRMNEYKQRINTLKERVDTLPKIEAELASLNRNYTINKRQYDDLLKRRQSAELSQEVEYAGDQVKFQVIEPPRVPLTPASPNRPLFNAVVLLVAIGGGLGLVFLFSQLNPVVHDQKTLRRLTKYPVFGSISIVRGPDMIKKRKADIIIYAVSITLLTLIFIAIVVMQSIL